MPVMVKALGYYSHKGGKAAKGISNLKKHLKYLEFGKEHRSDPQGFTDREEPISRAEFLEQVQNQPERGVIAHKLVFSISEDEQSRLGTNMRDLVREVMDAWSQSLGRVLKWIGFEHDDPGHPHVHVVVAGYADGKQVGVYERDLRDLRSWAEREKERQVERGRPRREDRAIEQEVERLTQGIGRERGWDRGR
jgi:hypothetical protein